MKPILNLFLLCLFLSSCADNAVETITVRTDKDLIPEGIALAGNKIFLSSVHKNKIIEYDIDQKKATDFIHAGTNGFMSGVGLLVKDNILYALTNDVYSKPNQSALFLFDIDQKTFLKKFDLIDGQDHFLNDLAIDNNNRAYITDTKQSKVFTLDLNSQSFSEFLTDTSVAYVNGITISDDNKLLFIASATNGVRILELSTKKYLNDFSKETRGIDGMKYHDHAIYAIKNGEANHSHHGLIKISLSPDNRSIQKTEDVLLGDKTMSIPTTLGISNNFTYILANSQLGNLNQDNNQIVNKDSLTETFILKLRMQ